MAVLVTLDGVVHDPDAPLLCADDAAAVRGDGVFETLLVRDGRTRLVDAHLRRFVGSAEALDLPVPDLDAWRAAIAVAAGQWGAAEEGALRLTYSRGRDGAGPTAYVTVAALSPHVAAARTDGLSALVLDLGISAHGADRRPWLLAGAKTLSYAVNMAALRYAAGRGADDVIFVSTEGQVLEGPRSTVVVAVDGDDGRPCLLTPPPWYPILRGTTQRALFEAARNAGYDCDYRALTATDLFAARGVWLVSSVTLAARVHTLDGRTLSPAPLAGAVEALADTAVSA
ncbi:MAG: aminodeoxychorismate lyase [Mycobacterium sp.]|nr:aminodeoxychorismate lyase [Mycobacterium sp.]